MMKKTLSFLALLVFCLNSHLLAATIIKDGPWRFELKTNYTTVPFVVDLKWRGRRLTGTLQNGKENIPLNEISYSTDQIFIPIQNYELRMELKVHDKNTLIGELVRLNKNPPTRFPMMAKQGIKHRYPGDKIKSSIKLHGKWAIKMTDEKGAESKGVLIFYQNGNFINGSILTSTGDYRYFDGYISDNYFEAASFDGVYNYVIKGKVDKNKLEASLLSNYSIKISGVYDKNADIPNPYTQTQVSTLNFKFPDLQGKMVSLKDDRFKNRPVIVLLFGSWCPNCLDELNFIIPWYNENKKKGIEAVILAFERSVTPEDAKYQLLKTQARFEIPFPLLIAGSTSDDKPAEKLPEIKNFISFPTTIFLNKSHEVIKVHAGFTGPSTGPFYERWKKEFVQTTDDLLK